MNKFAIIGSGAMGTAIAKGIYDSDEHNIVIYGIDQNELSDLSMGQNKKYFDNKINLPKFQVTNDLSKALKYVTHIVLAVPSQIMELVINKITKILNHKALFINVSKGFYPNTYKSLHEGIEDATHNNKFVRGVVTISGPSHAEDLVKESPTLLCSISKNKDLALEVQNIFKCIYIRLYVQTDVVGASVGAAYKNVLAIVAGMVNGLNMGINTIAALITRGLYEMQIFNKFMGGKETTILGLTGLGDLVVTATTNLSRNFTFGTNFIKNGYDELKTQKTVEGLMALNVLNKIGNDNKLKLPLLYGLFKVINKEISIDDVKKELLLRTSKME